MQIKSIVVGAAGLLAASSAFAADLPGAPEPVDYVRVCDAYGVGYFYIPGTETCLRVSGRIRADFYAWGNDKGASGIVGGETGWGTRTSNGITTRARGYLYLDSRTNTEFGLLRTYTELYATVNSGSETPSMTLDNAYIQFGGLTAGRAQSMYDFFTGYNFARIGEGYSDQKTNLLAYTYGFGSGFSATLSIEDPTFRNSGITYASTTLAGGDAYGGNRAVDPVLAVRVDQGWGSAQLSGVIHSVYGDTPQVGSSLGWAVQGGVEVNIPQLGPSTSVALQGAVGQGALSYISGGSYAPSAAFGGAYSSAVDATTDGNDLNLTTAWSVSGGVTHAWTQQWKSNLTATYVDADVDGSRASSIGDFQNFDVAGNLIYSPVSGLDIGGEVEYKYVSRQYGSDLNALVGILRVQRTF